MDEATRVAKLVVQVLFGKDVGAMPNYAAASTEAVRELLQREAWKVDRELARKVVVLTEERDALQMKLRAAQNGVDVG